MFRICVSGEDNKLLLIYSAAKSHLLTLRAFCNAKITWLSSSKRDTAFQNASGSPSYNVFIWTSSGSRINWAALSLSFITLPAVVALA